MNKNFYHNKIILAINKKCSEKKIKMPAAKNIYCIGGGQKMAMHPQRRQASIYIYKKGVTHTQ